MIEKPSIIEDRNVNWKAFLELQNKHEVGKPSQTAYQTAVDELLKARKLSKNAWHNYTITAGGGCLLRSPTEPVYFTNEADAQQYSALRWPGLEGNVHRITIFALTGVFPEKN
jgi:hypothetical protein